MELERVQAMPVRILIYDEDGARADLYLTVFADAIPSSTLVVARSLEQYQQELQNGDFDIVIVDYDVPAVQAVDFLPELQLRDYEPDVLLVSKCEDQATVRKIAKTRLRYVVRDEAWSDEVAYSVRDMLRIRQLKSENSTIKARLIEANGMLDEKNQRLDEFCATIAHDIRGPLASLILKIDYILETYEDEFNERCTKLLNRSLDSANRLVGVVQAMYEFAKVGARASKMEQIDLHQLVNDVITDLNVDESKEISIGVGDLPEVWGDPGLMRRVFINLISNAIKYNDKSDVRINVGYDGDLKRSIADFARIYVEDNGPGIPAEEAKGIFTMFSRGRTSTEDESEGLGIGLAVVQKIVELHFGKVELATGDGHGCKFTFSLPREKVQIGV